MIIILLYLLICRIAMQNNVQDLFSTKFSRNMCYDIVSILPAFINTLRSGLNQSQTFWTLTKYLWKNINIYNIKIIALESSQSIFSYYAYLALWILILFTQFLVKVYKI
jgi:hypothetical protein